MRKALLILLVAALATSAMAQEIIDPTEYIDSIQAFADGVGLQSQLHLNGTVSLKHSKSHTRFIR